MKQVTPVILKTAIEQAQVILLQPLKLIKNCLMPELLHYYGKKGATKMQKLINSCFPITEMLDYKEATSIT